MSGFIEQTAGPEPAPAHVLEPGLKFRNALLLSFGYAPLLCLFFLNLWERPHYQFFPLAILGAFALAWMRLDEVPRPFQQGGALISVLACTGSFLVLSLATLYWSPWMASLAALLGLAGAFWFVGGWTLLRAMVPTLVLLLAIIPPPLALDTRFAEHLRMLAVNWSSHLLDLLAVTHSRSGNIIEIPGQKLLVEEACSGINSVLVTMACCLFYLLWRRRSIIRILICLACSISFVLLGNLVRITFGAWLKFRHGIDILTGWRHQLIGLLLFCTYIGLILSLDRWLSFLTSPVRARKLAAAPVPATPLAAMAPVARISGRWTGAAAGAFALLGIAGLGLGWEHHQLARSQRAIPASALRAGATFAMPDRIGDWTRMNSESPLLQKVETMGVCSQVWHFKRKEVVASLALDYPFTGYHDVTLCYTLRGWKVVDRVVHADSKANSRPAVTQVRMQDGGGMEGALWFSTVDENGRWLETPLFERTLLDRWKISGAIEPTTYRVQALAASYSPLSTAEQAQLRDFFEQARMLLWKQLSAQMRPHS